MRRLEWLRRDDPLEAPATMEEVFRLRKTVLALTGEILELKRASLGKLAGSKKPEERFLTMDELRKWCHEGYIDPNTGERVFGRDLLLRFFFSRDGFWTHLAAYSLSLDETVISSLGGRIPTDKGIFLFRLKKLWFDRLSPKNLCIGLGILDSERAILCDNAGWLSSEGLKRWCHEGYTDPNTGEHVLGKDFLKQAYVSGKFWESLKDYSEKLSLEEAMTAGGKFPYHQLSLAERMGKTEKTVTISEWFDWLGIEAPTKAKTVTNRWYLSDEELRKWCREGYIDPNTKERIFGKDILLGALFSGSFYRALQTYVESLSDACIEVIGGRISWNCETYERRMAYLPKIRRNRKSPKNVCLWFGALNNGTERFCTDTGHLSEAGLRNWCHEGYLDPATGKRIFGKDILKQAYVSGKFWESLKGYSEKLSLEQTKAIGGKFPYRRNSFTTLMGEVGKSVTIPEWFDWIGIETPTKITGTLPAPNEYLSEKKIEAGVWSAQDTVKDFENWEDIEDQEPWEDSDDDDIGDMGESIVKRRKKQTEPVLSSKEREELRTLGKIRIILTKLLREAWAPPDGKHWTVKDFHTDRHNGCIRIECLDSELLESLRNIRTHVDETLIQLPEVTDGLEESIIIDWEKTPSKMPHL